MAIHRFEQDQWLPITREQAWRFFSNPANLTELTPPNLAMRLLGEPEPLHEGQIIRHQVRILPGIHSVWVSEIKAIEPGRAFVDEQRAGPFQFWHHRHAIDPEDGGVRLRDVVHYRVGFGPLGDLANSLFLRRLLRNTFAFRRSILATKFGTPSP